MKLFYSLLLLFVSVQSLADVRFVKVSNQGKALPDDASEWSCVYDRKNKLMWEVKTNDKGLRDAIWTYTWYDSTQSKEKQGTKVDLKSRTQCFNPGNCNTEYYVNAVNKAGLCGFNDWQLPSQTNTIRDGSHQGALDSLINCPGGYSDNWVYYYYCLDAQKYKPNLLDQRFFINLDRATRENVGYQYFSPYYWSRHVYDGNDKYTWWVNIETGGLTQGDQSLANHVLLSRNAPNFNDTIPPTPPAPPTTRRACVIPADTTALCKENGISTFTLANASVNNGAVCESYSTGNLAIAGKSFQCADGNWNMVGSNSYCEVTKNNYYNGYCTSKYVTNGFSCFENKEVYRCVGNKWVLLK
jgi:hypothetical protein